MIVLRYQGIEFLLERLRVAMLLPFGNTLRIFLGIISPYPFISFQFHCRGSSSIVIWLGIRLVYSVAWYVGWWYSGMGG